MSEAGEGSVTHWLLNLKEGGDEAVAKLWDRYFEKLVRVAAAKLKSSRSRAEDGEDAALSAFQSFIDGVEREKFPKLNDRDDLWRILVVIASRKASRRIAREQALKRGEGNVVLEADLPRIDDDRAIGLELALGTEPTGEFALMVAEEYDRLMNALGDDSLREVARMKMEGLSIPEIARSMNCSSHIVKTKVMLIRKIWEKHER